jgi:glycerol kinase
MKAQYLIALDQGTTSSRALLFSIAKQEVVDVSQYEFTQYFPHNGWVEHDADEIWDTQWQAFSDLMERNQLKGSDILAVGITNQRETTVLWDRATSKPVHKAIVWQDKRTAPICEALKKQNLEDYVRENTGLVIDSYFSGTKLQWLLDNDPALRARAQKGELAFGTIDTWLIWKLSKSKAHCTDYSNASRTMLFNIKNLDWDARLLDVMNIPKSVLPQVKTSAEHFADFEWQGERIPIMAVAGDQQAALFGQACFTPGMAKNTYGTGCFMLMNTGTERVISKNGLLTTIAWGIGKEVHYALEGSVFIAGAAVQWLRDGLRLIDTAPDSEYFASKVGEEHGVYVVPAFTGLGAPYWDMYARGAIFGLTRDTGKKHIVRATLESLAYQSKDVLDAMEQDAGLSLKTLKVDGGAAANDLLMQFQSDILGVDVERPSIIESTALGVIYMAGLAAGIWGMDELTKARKLDKVFKPGMEAQKSARLYKGWKKAVARSMDWMEE